MFYVAVDVGCIECGEESAVIGIFTDKESAEKALEEHGDYQAANWGGQHSFELFEVESLDKALKVGE